MQLHCTSLHMLKSGAASLHKFAEIRRTSTCHKNHPMLACHPCDSMLFDAKSKKIGLAFSLCVGSQAVFWA